VIVVGSGRSRPEPVTTSAIVASDLHSNRLVLPALGRFARGKTLFFVGDFTELGAGIETGVAAEIARTGSRVVAVSGNHDSAPFMRALAAKGVTVLTRDGVLAPGGATKGGPLVEVDGLAVAGWDDSLENDGSLGQHRLAFDAPALVSEGRRVTAWFSSLPRRPDVVLVHRHGLAHALLEHVARDPGAEPLLVLTGHDHAQHYEQEGEHVLVDGGTVGAGGPFGVGVAPAGFAQLHLDSSGSLEALDLIEIEPLFGQASARRVAFDRDPTIPLVPDRAAPSALDLPARRTRDLPRPQPGLRELGVWTGDGPR
jgi:predicted phosphodiesterase